MRVGHSTLTEKIHRDRIGRISEAMRSMEKIMTNYPEHFNEERTFSEFRRKVKSAEVLSASMERLLLSLRFTGKVSVVMQNGRVLKSGYEEAYFRNQGSAGQHDETTQNLEAEETNRRTSVE